MTTSVPLRADGKLDQRAVSGPVVQCWFGDWEGARRNLRQHLHAAAKKGTHPKDPPAATPEPEVRVVEAVPGSVLAEPHHLPFLLGLNKWAAVAGAVLWLLVSFALIGFVSAVNGFAIFLGLPGLAAIFWLLTARGRVAPVLAIEWTETGNTVAARWEWWEREKWLLLPPACIRPWGKGKIAVVERFETPLVFDPAPPFPPEVTSEDIAAAVEQSAIGTLVTSKTRRQQVFETIQTGAFMVIIGILVLGNFLMAVETLKAGQTP